MTPKKGASQEEIQEGLKKWNAKQEEMKNTKPLKDIAVPAVNTRAILNPKDKGFVGDPPAPGTKVSAPPRRNDVPVKPQGKDIAVPAVKKPVVAPTKINDTVNTNRGSVQISKPADTTRQIPTTVVKKPDVAPSVKSTGMPRPAPSTPPAEKGLGAVAPSAKAGINAVQNVVKKAVPQVAQATKMPAPAPNQIFKPKTMKKGGKTSCYSSGGSTSGASKRGDGIAIRGKTRGKIC